MIKFFFERLLPPSEGGCCFWFANAVAGAVFRCCVGHLGRLILPVTEWVGGGAYNFLCAVPERTTLGGFEPPIFTSKAPEGTSMSWYVMPYPLGHRVIHLRASMYCMRSCGPLSFLCIAEHASVCCEAFLAGSQRDAAGRFVSTQYPARYIITTSICTWILSRQGRELSPGLPRDRQKC